MNTASPTYSLCLSEYIAKSSLLFWLFRVSYQLFACLTVRSLRFSASCVECTAPVLMRTSGSARMFIIAWVDSSLKGRSSTSFPVRVGLVANVLVGVLTCVRMFSF